MIDIHEHSWDLDLQAEDQNYESELADESELLFYDFVNNQKEEFVRSLGVKDELIEDENNYVDLDSDSRQDIDSLVCDKSTVLSDDWLFLNKNKNNYIHLMLRPSGVTVFNTET